MAEIAAGEDDCLGAGFRSGLICGGDGGAEFGAFVDRNMGQRDRDEGKLIQNALEKRQLDLDAMLVGMGLSVESEEVNPRLQKIAQRLVDRNISQWSSPARPGTQSGSMTLGAMVDTQQDHAMHRRVDAGVKLRRAGTGINRPGMGDHARNNGWVGLADPLRSQRTCLETVVEQRVKFLNGGRVERPGHRGGPERGHGTPLPFYQGATIS